MSERTLRTLDLVSAALLLLWTGIGLGIAMIAAPVAFHVLPSRELAGSVIGASFHWVDFLAWFAFGLALLLTFGSRWLSEIKDKSLGPLQLWNAAALAALLLCFTSVAVVNPKMAEIHARLAVPIESLPKDHPDRVAFSKAHRVAQQLLAFRLLLALGMAAGIGFLPRRKEIPEA